MKENPQKSQYSQSEMAVLVERLAQVGIALSLEKDPDKLLEMILLEAKSIAHADGGTLYTLNDYNQLEYTIVRTNSLHLSYGGTDCADAPFPPVNLYNNETGMPNVSTQVVQAVLSRQAVNIDDVYTSQAFDFTGTRSFDAAYGYHTKSVLTIPMVNHKHEAIGCLQLVNAIDTETGSIIPFSADMCRIVQALASQAAVILDNKQLITGQRALLESFIRVIAHATDAKSPYTGNHCQRVPLLTEMLAEAACAAQSGPLQPFNLSEDEKYELHIAAWLHDCGKIVTPVHVMDKSTKLETIHDRIYEILTRLEVLRRDAKIALLEGQIDEPAYEERLEQIDSDAEFLEIINIGGEYMEDAAIERLHQIATTQWEYQDELRPLLSENEVYNLSTRKGTITPEEREIMNDHMVHTVEMLESMPWPKHLQRVPEYACGHHEKMDGTGYPKGLLAGTMSIPARMMAVADVFEALTAGDRPYKEAKTLSQAMAIIAHLKRCNHLDPMLVDFFITSGVYRVYAERFLPPHLIDAVDEQAILSIVPQPMQLRMRGDRG